MLKKLHAAIIDCPGLQASRWDTQITNRCIHEAHAIIFLLGTHSTGMSESDVEEVKKFREYGLENNVFYGYNAKSVSKKIAVERLLPNDLALLQKAGFELTPEQFSIFNALLACRVKQYKLKKAGDLDPDTIRALSRKAGLTLDLSQLPTKGEDNIANADLLMTNDIRQAYNQFTTLFEVNLTDEFLRQAEAISNWEEMVQTASSFMIRRRGEAILLDRGARQLKQILERVEGDLRDREMLAERTQQQEEQEKADAERALRFVDVQITEIKQEVVRDLQNRWQPALAADLRAVLKDASAELRSSLTTVVRQMENPRDLGVKLASTATGLLSRKLTGWQSNIASDSNQIVQQIRKETIEPAESKIKELAADVSLKSPALLGGFSVIMGRLKVDFDMDDVAAALQSAIPISPFTAAADWTENLLDEFDPAGLGAYFKILRKEYNQSVRDRRDEFADMIPGLVEAILQRILPLVEPCLVNEVKGLVDKVSAEISQAVHDIREIYNQRLQQRELDFKKSLAEKARVVAEATANRAVIESFQARVEDFIRRALESLMKG